MLTSAMLLLLCRGSGYAGLVLLTGLQTALPPPVLGTPQPREASHGGSEGSGEVAEKQSRAAGAGSGPCPCLTGSFHLWFVERQQDPES